MTQNDFVEVAKVNEIPDGKMKHVEIEGKEALIANVAGEFYAVSDRGTTPGSAHGQVPQGLFCGNPHTQSDAPPIPSSASPNFLAGKFINSRSTPGLPDSMP
jgi:hypothetical protein